MRPFRPLALLFVIALATTASAQQRERDDEDEWPCAPPRSVIIVKWAEDAAKAIQAAIDQAAATPGPDKVVVPHVGQPWIASETLNLCSELTLEFEPGVVLWAKPGGFQGKNDCLIKGEGVKCVTLRGYGATLRMRKHDYLMDPETYERSEWRHCVKFNFASEYIQILGLTIECAGGDGIYVGWDTRSTARPCRNVCIRDVTCRDNLRQGISITCADGVTIENCLLTRTEGNNPEAGLDIEPNRWDYQIKAVEIRKCWFVNNAGSGVLVNLECLSVESPRGRPDYVEPVDIVLEDCLVYGCDDFGIRVKVPSRPPLGYEKWSITFRNCTVEDSCIYPPLQTIPIVHLENCRWAWPTTWGGDVKGLPKGGPE